MRHTSKTFKHDRGQITVNSETTGSFVVRFHFPFEAGRSYSQDLCLGHLYHEGRGYKPLTVEMKTLAKVQTLEDGARALCRAMLPTWIRHMEANTQLCDMASTYSGTHYGVSLFGHELRPVLTPGLYGRYPLDRHHLCAHCIQRWTTEGRDFVIADLPEGEPRTSKEQLSAWAAHWEVKHPEYWERLDRQAANIRDLEKSPTGEGWDTANLQLEIARARWNYLLAQNPLSSFVAEVMLLTRDFPTGHQIAPGVQEIPGYGWCIVDSDGWNYARVLLRGGSVVTGKVLNVVLAQAMAEHEGEFSLTDNMVFEVEGGGLMFRGIHTDYSIDLKDPLDLALHLRKIGEWCKDNRADEEKIMRQTLRRVFKVQA